MCVISGFDAYRLAPSRHHIIRKQKYAQKCFQPKIGRKKYLVFPEKQCYYKKKQNVVNSVSYIG